MGTTLLTPSFIQHQEQDEAQANYDFGVAFKTCSVVTNGYINTSKRRVSDMVEETSHEGSNEERSSDPTLESVHKEMARYIKRGIALMVAGFMMPVIVGVGAAAFTAAFVTTPSGMDPYWPLLVGAFWGAFLGLGLLFSGVGQFLKAWRCKRVVSRLTD